MKKNIPIIILILISSVVKLCANTNNKDNSNLEYKENSAKEPNILIPIAITSASFITLTAVGVSIWDWDLNKIPKGELTWHNDGFFGENTGYGGADKLGHAYSTMILSNILIESMKMGGYNDDSSILFGSLVSFLLMTYVELGDATEDKYGFEAVDVLFDGIGALLSYGFYKYPRFNDFIDYRLEYEFTGSISNTFGSLGSSYDTQKYNLLFQMSGFKRLEKQKGLLKVLQFTEFGVQYYTRNFADNTDDKQRVLKFIVGFNMPLGIKKLGNDNNKYLNATSLLFNYVQMPYTYISY